MISEIEFEEYTPDSFVVSDIFNIVDTTLVIYEDNKVILESSVAEEIHFDSIDAFLEEFIYDENNLIYYLDVIDDGHKVTFKVEEEMFGMLEALLDD